ncbi:DUF6048 family protein [Flagellimonas lutaonensis]|uniref:Outer membrane protein beta-barrel domain-containing protein n=1 Tax=Flagellimonas lutaonensis TaxID=516051 RepID=A0A0D5YUH2_9FLAO|nr:DUF6048 family protein [Allomuricauda lutaonensis]AKA35992.1 hypothetical protein VC82_2410 [Allomuricauda lutaonensis]
MSRYFISPLFFFATFWGFTQNESSDRQQRDTVPYHLEYGLRVGIDLSRPVLSFANNGYTGIEFVGDYRFSDKIWLAGELGNEKRTDQEDLYNFTTSGSYLKLGVDYNTYQNWYGMNNSITIGGRYAVASFSQTLNEYQIYDSNRYFYADDFVVGGTQPEEFSGLNATWLEMVLGMKAELFANIYIGMSVRLGHLVTNKEADRFPNLWIPGFNKVTDGAKWGVGYNYSISYFLPLYKKAKKKRVPAEEEGSE